MKYYPSYYYEFRCIADKCSDSCCKEWEITIDKETFEKYRTLQGKIGDRIRSFIREDADADYCFSLVDGKCPFLNDSGLCDIHITFDESMTSTICREHPRFIEEYDGFTEISLSVSCPEAARIIFDQNPEKSIYPTPEYDGDDEVLAVLISSRKEILNASGSIFAMIDRLSAVSCRDEEEINHCTIDNAQRPSLGDIKKFICVLGNECEILNPEWLNLLNNCPCVELENSDFSEFLDAVNVQLSDLFCYLVYRYYLKSVCDLNIFPRGQFIAYSVLAVSLIAYCNSMSVTEVSRLFSKEIEHSTENVDILIDSLSF